MAGNQTSEEGEIIGKSATFLSFGAIIRSFRVADTDINIVQGFETVQDYRDYNEPYFGETIGRVANRIAGARINDLNGGKSYKLDCNDGNANCLHGGFAGWGKKEWSLASEERLTNETGLKNGVRRKFTYCSEDGDGGFPGVVDVSVTFTDCTENVGGRNISVLEVEYEAELVGGQDVNETVVAMTNHSYFNLHGANTSATTDGIEATLSTTTHLPVNASNIPTGEMAQYPGLEPNKPFTLSAQHSEIDHCFVLSSDPKSIPTDTRQHPAQKLGSFFSPTSHVRLEVHSTEPAFQFYMGKHIDVPAVGDLPARGPRTGFCIEPSRYVNAVNVEEWRDMVVLRRGEKYGSRIVYRAWRDKNQNS